MDQLKDLFRARSSTQGSIESQNDLFKEYIQAVLRTPELLRRLAFRTRTLEEELQEAMLRGQLRQSFNKLDLLMLGTGIVIGSGVFQLTGLVAAVYAGSATFLCYLLTGISMLCSACCYAELCVEYPVAGSVFTYTLVTFGEFPAFITFGMLILEYVLGMAAVARSFSRYLALLIGQPASLFTLNDSGDWHYYPIDLMAFGVVLLLSAALSFGVRESSLVLGLMSIVKLCLIFSIIVAGFAKSNPLDFANNFILPDSGVDGIFQGAAIILFAYVAFDAICNAVEEAREPAFVPPAILGTVGISGVIYMFMAVSLCLIVTPQQLRTCVSDTGDPITPQPDTCSMPNTFAYNLAFTYAFTSAGLPAMKYIVSLAALFGITTSLLVGLFSVARLVMVVAREWLVFPFLANISPRTQSPVIAQMTLGAIIAVVAMLVNFSVLSELVSFATLVAVWVVSNIVLYRRYYPTVKMIFTSYGTVEAAAMRDYSKAEKFLHQLGMSMSVKTRKWLVGFHVIAINGVSLALAIYYNSSYTNESQNYYGSVYFHTEPYSFVFVGIWAMVTCSMVLLCPIVYEPKVWAIKWYLLPWLPSLSIFLVIFSLANLQFIAFEGFVIYLGILIVVYVFISMPFSYIRHFKLSSENVDRLAVIEMVYKNGKWQSLAELTSQGNPHGSSSHHYSSVSGLHPFSTGGSSDRGGMKTAYSGHSGSIHGSVRAGMLGNPTPSYVQMTKVLDRGSGHAGSGGMHAATDQSNGSEDIDGGHSFSGARDAAAGGNIAPTDSPHVAAGSGGVPARLHSTGSANKAVRVVLPVVAEEGTSHISVSGAGKQ